MMSQISQVSYVHTAKYTTSSAELLADLVLGCNPFGLSKAYFINSGSEAMDAAMKMARQYHYERGDLQRKCWVSRRQAYHGNTIGAMSVSSNLPRLGPYKNAMLLPDVSFVSAPYAYRGQRESESEEDYATRLVEEVDLEFQKVGPENVIAFIGETMGGATAACIVAPKGYFEGIRELCTKYGILLILDEVMCGSGRTGSYFAFEQEANAIPDIVTVGKGLGGGYAPIAGIYIHDRIIEALRQGTGAYNHGHTYQAHPVSCAAALATQRIIRRDNLVSQCAAKGEILKCFLERQLSHKTYIGDIRGRGLFWGLEFVQDKASKKPFNPSVQFGNRVAEACHQRGLDVYPGQGTVDGLVGDHVILAPPLIITNEEIETMVGILVDAYCSVEAEMDGV
ncbi:PLP-dependent transferase [Sarocladium strictum]